MCAGFLAVELVPSPKIHFQESGDPVLLSVNATLKGAYHVVTLLLKLGIGFCTDGFTFILFVFEFVPFALLTVSITV